MFLHLIDIFFNGNIAYIDFFFNSKATSRVAKLTVNREFDASNPPSTLFPRSHGNIHAIHALAETAMFDILVPPYSDKQNRPCTYYKEALRLPKTVTDQTLLERFLSKESSQNNQTLNHTEEEEEKEGSLVMLTETHPDFVCLLL
jgi:hypothetical protein